MTDQGKIELLRQRRQFFEENFPAARQTLFRKDKNIQLSNTCPACGYPTLDERNAWEICAICWWEDDGQDDADADEIRGGPNGGYSLTQWRLEVDKTLAALTDDVAECHPKKREAGIALKMVQSILKSNYAVDMAMLGKQIRMVMLLFDKLHLSRLVGSPNFAPNTQSIKDKN